MNRQDETKNSRKQKAADKLAKREERILAALVKKEEKHRALFMKKREKLGILPEPEPEPEPPKKKVIGLCLGGGGARGFAHIGAFKAFSEAGLAFDVVAGTSVGSLMGALYCAGVSLETMIEYAATIDKKSIKKGPIWSPDDSSKIGKIVSDLIGDIEFKDLKKPFYAVAVNLITGREVIIDRGSVAQAVAASCTVPLLYKPYVYNDMHLVDGGLLNNIPADVCRMMGADAVVTVDVNPTRGGGTAETGIFAVLKASFSIMGSNASINGLVNSDVVIAPDMSKFKSTAKSGYDEMIETGYQATKEKIDEIKKIFASES